jgi:hypothetical protein
VTPTFSIAPFTSLLWERLELAESGVQQDALRTTEAQRAGWDIR